MFQEHKLGPIRQIKAGVLDVGYHDIGPGDGPPVLLLHGWPYDVHSYVDVAPMLAAHGCRVIVPHLRGHGTTRFRESATPRAGQQAAIGADLIALMDALHISRAVVPAMTGAACVAAALWHWNERDQAASARSWLYRIATNTAYDHLPRQRRVGICGSAAR